MKIINKLKGNTRLALLLVFGVFLIGLVISIRWLSSGDGLSSGGAVAVVPRLSPAAVPSEGHRSSSRIGVPQLRGAATGSREHRLATG